MATAAPKSGLSFSFSKKAEPKRVVKALAATRPDNDGREEINAVEDGQVAVVTPKAGQGPLAIPCKNPLEEPRRPPAAKRPPAAPPAEGSGETGDAQQPRELPAGLVKSHDLSKLAAEDAEAMRELLKDAGAADDVDGASSSLPVAPILMREGSRRVRDNTAAPEANKDMFDSVPVENFGEALLRGMGYDPKVHTTKPVVRDKLRDSLLGLGAKALLPHEKAKIANKRPAPPGAGGSTASSAPAKAAGTAEESSEKKRRVEVADATESTAEASRKNGTTSGRKPNGQIPLARGVIVRIIGKQGQLRDFCGRDAVVLEVTGSREAGEDHRLCRIKARGADDKSHVLEEVRPEDLEARQPRG